MVSIRALMFLVPLAACAGAQAQPLTMANYNVPQIGGAGLSPIGEGGLSFERTLPRISPPQNYNFPQAGGAGLVAAGTGGFGVSALALRGRSLPGAGDYNVPQIGGAGLVPLSSGGINARPVAQ